MNGWLDEWMNAKHAMHRCINEWLKEWISKGKNERKKENAEGRNEWINWWENEWLDAWIAERNERMYAWFCHWVIQVHEMIEVNEINE